MCAASQDLRAAHPRPSTRQTSTSPPPPAEPSRSATSQTSRATHRTDVLPCCRMRLPSPWPFGYPTEGLPRADSLVIHTLVPHTAPWVSHRFPHDAPPWLPTPPHRSPHNAPQAREICSHQSLWCRYALLDTPVGAQDTRQVATFATTFHFADLHQQLSAPPSGGGRGGKWWKVGYCGSTG